MNIRLKLITFLSIIALVPLIVISAFFYFSITNELFSIIEIRNWLIGIVIFSFMYIVIGVFYFSQIFMRPIITLTEKTNRVIQGDLSQKIEVSSSDEIGKLADSFNKMTTQLSDSYGKLEQKVTEKTTELNQKVKEMERINKYMMGRELRMIDLKKEVASLREEFAKHPELVAPPPPKPTTMTT